jgi:DNA adenine methylase
MRLNLLKTFGGKGTASILKWLLANFPSDYRLRRYIEPYGGGGALLLNKSPSIQEVWNDINRDTYLVFKYAQSNALSRVATAGGYGEAVFNFYKDDKNFIGAKEWYLAEREFILRNMSRSGMKKDFAWSDRLRGGQPGDVNAWNNKLKNLSQISKRLRNVGILNEDAITVLRKFNFPDTFTYLDPPYLPITRVSKKVYDNEMTCEQHEELLKFLTTEWKGLFLLSGYDNSLYEKYLKNCIKQEKKTANNAGQTKKKSTRFECIWRNY